MAGFPEQFDDAVRLLRSGKLDEAAAACRALLLAVPDSPAVLDLLGMIARIRGKHAEALEHFTAALVQGGQSPTLHLHRGAALRAVGGRDEEAVGEFRAAIALQPESAEAHHQLGNTLKALGRLAEASVSLEQATKLAPDDATIRLNLGVAQFELRRVDAAIANFRQAVELDATRPEAWNILGVALWQKGETTVARGALTKALQLRPNYAAAHDNLAMALKSQGRVAEAVGEFRAALAVALNPATHSNLAYALNFLPSADPDDVFAEHRTWNEIYAKPLQNEWTTHQNDHVPNRRLKVGFVSADLMDHAVAYFFEPFLAARDRQALDVTCYSDVRVGDRVTERLRALSDRWRDTAVLSDAQLAAQIRADGIDVLVDLAGHTADNRLLVFARKPAPVQVTWLGYPNTTGLSAIDYRITDAVSDPEGKTERWHSETLVRIPDGFLCYRPPEDSPEAGIAPPAGAPITFASLSNFAKLSDPCLETWAHVMSRVSDSRLILKSRGLGDAAAVERVHVAFGRWGIGPERIELIPRLSSVSEHLALYHRIDIALDPFPYNGTTTTCEALWMGVPVVTLAGQTHVQRVGASLLTALGEPNLIAPSIDEYLTKCVTLAAEVARLRTTRVERRDRMRLSPLCDAGGFSVKLTRALREMWERYCARA